MGVNWQRLGLARRQGCAPGRHCQLPASLQGGVAYLGGPSRIGALSVKSGMSFAIFVVHCHQASLKGF